MHFQATNDYYLNLTSRLKKIVPEFKSIFDDDDIVYPILADFCEFLIINLNNDDIIAKCMIFINEALEIGDNRTEDAIVIQVFQPIYHNYDVINKIRPMLTEKATLIFDNFNLI